MTGAVKESRTREKTMDSHSICHDLSGCRRKLWRRSSSTCTSTSEKKWLRGLRLWAVKREVHIVTSCSSARKWVRPLSSSQKPTAGSTMVWGRLAVEKRPVPMPTSRNIRLEIALQQVEKSASPAKRKTTNTENAQPLAEKKMCAVLAKSRNTTSPHATNTWRHYALPAAKASTQNTPVPCICQSLARAAEWKPDENLWMMKFASKLT